MLADGIPMIYQGQEQGFTGSGVPSNREALWSSGFATDSSPLYQFIKLMNAIRRHAIATNKDYLSYQSHVIYSDNSSIAFRKGVEGRQIVTLLSSGGEGMGDYQLDLATAYGSDVQVVDVVECRNYTVNQYGQLTLPMGGGLPKVLFPAAKMNGSQLCGFGDVPLEILMQGAAAASLGRGSSFAASVGIVAVAAMACFLI
jgi:alpha-amylase